MKKIVFFIVWVAIALLVTACSDISGTPPERQGLDFKILSVGSRSVSVKWSDLGDGYYYTVVLQEKRERLWFSEGDTLITIEIDTVLEIENRRDTVFTAENLSPNTDYSIIVNFEFSDGQVWFMGTDALTFRTQEQEE